MSGYSLSTLFFQLSATTLYMQHMYMCKLVEHNYEYVQLKQTLLKGMEYFFITCGEMSDIL
jgi:hypothetical protein